MKNWKDIHQGFRYENIKEGWEKYGFAYERVKEWIEVGLKPTEYKLAFSFEIAGYPPCRVRKHGDLSKLKESLFEMVLEKEDEHEQRTIACLRWNLKIKGKLLIRSENKIKELNKRNEELHTEILNRQVHNRHLLQGLSSQLGGKEKELRKILQENDLLRKENAKFKQEKFQTQQKELENLKNSLKIKLEEDDCEDLIDLLESQVEFSKNNNPYIKKQLERSKKRLLRNEKLTKEEIEKVCEVQNELAELENELSKCQLENKIEIILK